MPASADPNPRDRLIDAALRLFNAGGFHASGIEAILAEAGVAKMTLYNHFTSKDDLILAALRRRDERFRHWFVRAVERRAETPAGRLLAAFDALGEWFAGADFHGCLFINASAEFGAADHPAHAAAAEHKRLIRRHVLGLAREAGATSPDALADQLMLLIEGAIVLAHVCGDRNAAATAKGAARPLLLAQGIGLPP